MKPVNLLPQSSRPHQPSGKLGGSAYWVVGGLAMVLVMAIAYVFTANQVTSRESELARLQQETTVAQQRAATLSSFGSFAEVAQTRLASVRDLATVRFDWERVMREVAHVVPREIWLLDLSASTAPQDSSGGAADMNSPTSAAVPLSPSLKLSGCAPDQNDVANLLVRLHKLHDADDVSLAESTKQTGVDGAPSDSAGSSDSCPSNRYKFDVTVNFTAPSSASAEAESKDRVPVALGGGS